MSLVHLGILTHDKASPSKEVRYSVSMLYFGSTVYMRSRIDRKCSMKSHM